jgi:hypothetical protein
MVHAFNIYITKCPERQPDDENNAGLHASALGLITMETECFRFDKTSVQLKAGMITS